MPGSQTAPGRTGTRNNAPVRLAFRNEYSVGAQIDLDFRGSMAGLCDPLPTLRRHPHGSLRTARGRCGLLSFIVADLHRLLLAGLPAHAQSEIYCSRPFGDLPADTANDRLGSCVTSVAGPNGGAQLYER